MRTPITSTRTVRASIAAVAFVTAAFLAGGAWAAPDDHGEQVPGAHVHVADEEAPTNSAHAHSHHRDYDALWAAATPEERAAATKLVEDTRAAVALYADYDAAVVAGYHANPRRGRSATHHPNRSLMRDGRVLDPAAPESLMYWTAPDGRKVLVGVMYKAPPGSAAPAPGGELTAWHTHAAGRKCYPAQDPSCPQDATKMLHVFFFDGVQDPFTERMAAAAGGRRAFARAMRD